MSTVDHVEALKAKHASLEHAISEENARPLPDDDAICSLKKKKAPDQGRDHAADRQASTNHNRTRQRSARRGRTGRARARSAPAHAREQRALS